jgi:SAM-dependent methyltransferase
LYSPHETASSRGDVTDVMRSFYEENPFPDYEDLDSDWSLRERAQRGVFARLLDEQIPHDARILEVGCGTGQLSNFLSMRWGRVVFGSDLSLPSLRLGREFSVRHRLENVAFLQMNLFRPAFKPESFDVVICNGVLHHTADPFRGLRSISQLAKPGGYVLVGLYNTYGRIPTDFRRFIFRLSGDRLRFLDPRLRAGDVSDKRKHTWFMDQYRNPHESKHTIDEVLGWFDELGLEFVHGIPTILASEQMTENEKLFEASPKGTTLDHFLVQLGMLAKGGREGGFFIMIGRKTPAGPTS